MLLPILFLMSLDDYDWKFKKSTESLIKEVPKSVLEKLENIMVNLPNSSLEDVNLSDLINEQTESYTVVQSLFESPVYLHIMDGSRLAFDLPGTVSHVLYLPGDENAYQEMINEIPLSDKIISFLSQWGQLANIGACSYFAATAVLSGAAPSVGTIIGLTAGIGMMCYNSNIERRMKTAAAKLQDYVLGYVVLMEANLSVMKMHLLREVDIESEIISCTERYLKLIRDYIDKISDAITDNDGSISASCWVEIETTYNSYLREIINIKRNAGYSMLSIKDQEKLQSELNETAGLISEYVGHGLGVKNELLKIFTGVMLERFYLLEVKAAFGVSVSENKEYSKSIPVDACGYYECVPLPEMEDEQLITPTGLFSLGPVSQIGMVTPVRKCYFSRSTVIENANHGNCVDRSFSNATNRTESYLGFSTIKSNISSLTYAETLYRRTKSFKFMVNKNYADYAMIGDSDLICPMVVKCNKPFEIKKISEADGEFLEAGITDEVRNRLTDHMSNRRLGSTLIYHMMSLGIDKEYLANVILPMLANRECKVAVKLFRQLDTPRASTRGSPWSGSGSANYTDNGVGGGYTKISGIGNYFNYYDWPSWVHEKLKWDNINYYKNSSGRSYRIHVFQKRRWRNVVAFGVKYSETWAHQTYYAPMFGVLDIKMPFETSNGRYGDFLDDLITPCLNVRNWS